MLKISNSLTDDLRLPKYRGNPNQMAGHCYVASEAFYHIMGGKQNGLVPMFRNLGGTPHWTILDSKTNIEYDITFSQFGKEMQFLYYQTKPIRKGFLTKQPSKRAKILIERVQNG